MAKTRAPKAAKVGRPTRLDDDLRDRLFQMLENGCYLSHAAAVVGIDRRTLSRWIRSGREDLANGATDTAHAMLTKAVEEARNRGAAFMTEIITKAASRDWKAAAWYLERTQPQLFGPPTSDTVERDDVGTETLGNDDAAFEGDLANLNDGELELLDQLSGKAEQILKLGRSRRVGS